METKELIKIMSDPSFYPHRPEKVEVIQTHISAIFLAGDLVYKIKKPVNFGFVDFSTLEKRKYFCEKEVELNRRLSPDIYLGVEPIKIGSRTVEYAVVMKRLPMEKSLKRLVTEGKVSEKEIRRIAEIIADFHKRAKTTPEIQEYGKTENFRKNTDENFEQTEEFIGITIEKEDFEFIKAKTEEFYRKNKEKLNERAEKGFVKDCHGDLHSEHIVVGDEKIWIFDCIEFNERFRYIDVLCDLAFLLMDLDFLGRKDLAEIAEKTYLEKTKDPDAELLIPFFKCYRAYVRGKVNSLMLKDPNIPEEKKKEIAQTARAYFRLSRSYAEKIKT